MGFEKPGIGGERLPFQLSKPPHSSIPRGTGADLPSWVAFDKQVLNFDAYFQEAVFESREEQYRIRKCKVYFYLEDDSIQIVEPRMKNSGIPQGRRKVIFYNLQVLGAVGEGRECSFLYAVYSACHADNYIDE